MSITGRCPCGAVSFQVEGKPLLQLICHCPSCQLAHSAPMVRGAQFPAERFSHHGLVEVIRITAGPDATPRQTCAACGARVFNGSGSGPRTIFPELCTSSDWFRPEMHLYWSNRRVDVADDLPKYLEFPARLGGSDRRG